MKARPAIPLPFIEIRVARVDAMYHGYAVQNLFKRFEREARARGLHVEEAFDMSSYEVCIVAVGTPAIAPPEPLPPDANVRRVLP